MIDPEQFDEDELKNIGIAPFAPRSQNTTTKTQREKAPMIRLDICRAMLIASCVTEHLTRIGSTKSLPEQKRLVQMLKDDITSLTAIAGRIARSIEASE